VSKSGIPLYSNSLETTNNGLMTNLIMVGGKIIELSSIIRAIKLNPRKKIVKQNQLLILIEETIAYTLVILVTEENRTIRNKMLCFIRDFNVFYNLIPVEGLRDLEMNVPLKILIEKHFWEI
jgi:hypothetical protein